MSEPTADDVIRIWDANAAFWNERMGEGNRFHRELVEPATDDLLGDVAGRRVLDVACGNGQYARHLAGRGAAVVAFDGSSEMIRLARAATGPGLEVEYLVADAGDAGLTGLLGAAPFDAAVCTMALMDIADGAAVFRNVRAVLAAGGRFVFTVMHPAFNGSHATLTAEAGDEGEGFVTRFGVRVEGYLTETPTRGVAMAGQPELQWYFHRPLSVLLGDAFAAGFVVDGIAEPALAPGHDEPRPDLHWDGRFSEIPPVLGVRLRPV